MFSGQHSVTVPKDRSKINVIAKNLTEFEAHLLEKKLITTYGRKDKKTGILHNRTNGGEGASGAINSTQTRLKKSLAHKGKKLPPRSLEHAKKISESLTGKSRPKFSDNHKAKISAALKGKPKTPDQVSKWRDTYLHNKALGAFKVRELKVVTCPFCNKSGKGGNMTRYHFENCKYA